MHVLDRYMCCVVLFCMFKCKHKFLCTDGHTSTWVEVEASDLCFMYLFTSIILYVRVFGMYMCRSRYLKSADAVISWEIAELYGIY